MQRAKIIHFTGPYEIQNASPNLDPKTQLAQCLWVPEPMCGTTWLPRAQGFSYCLCFFSRNMPTGSALPSCDACYSYAPGASTHLELLQLLVQPQLGWHSPSWQTWQCSALNHQPVLFSSWWGEGWLLFQTTNTEVNPIKTEGNIKCSV